MQSPSNKFWGPRRVVEVHREPSQALGIAIVGGKVDLLSIYLSIYLQGVSKKMSFCGKTAITSFKLIKNAKVGGVLENSGYLLHYGCFSTKYHFFETPCTLHADEACPRRPLLTGSFKNL